MSFAVNSFVKLFQNIGHLFLQRYKYLRKLMPKVSTIKIRLDVLY